MDDCVLHDLYVEIRKKEIDPYFLQDNIEVIIEQINKEIDDYYKKHSIKEISPEEVFKNALRQTSTSKSNEANNIEQVELIQEKSIEGVLKDD